MCCKHVSCAVRKRVLRNIFLLSLVVTGDIGIIAAVAAGLSLPDRVTSERNFHLFYIRKLLLKYTFFFLNVIFGACNDFACCFTQINSVLK